MKSKKKKFKPIITRVKLNPEQAVLSCDCFYTGISFGSFIEFGYIPICGFAKSPAFSNETGSSTQYS